MANKKKAFLSRHSRKKSASPEKIFQSKKSSKAVTDESFMGELCCVLAKAPRNGEMSFAFGCVLAVDSNPSGTVYGSTEATAE